MVADPTPGEYLSESILIPRTVPAYLPVIENSEMVCTSESKQGIEMFVINFAESGIYFISQKTNLGSHCHGTRSAKVQNSYFIESSNRRECHAVTGGNYRKSDTYTSHTGSSSHYIGNCLILS